MTRSRHDSGPSGPVVTARRHDHLLGRRADLGDELVELVLGRDDDPGPVRSDARSVRVKRICVGPRLGYVTRVRMDEETAFEIVRRVLGVTVEPFDLDGRQKAVDALLHFPDGREGALEVSSLGPSEEAEITAFLGKEGWAPRTIDGLKNSWIVTIPRDFAPAELRKLDGLLLVCEQHDAMSLEDVYGRALLGQAPRDVITWIDAGVMATVLERTDGRSPQAWVTPDGVSGMTGNGASLLPSELATALAGKTMQSKLEKLNATGLAERHLFLWVRMTAFPFGVVDTIYRGGALSAEPPALPDGLTQVWLASGFEAGGVVRAIAGERWVRDNPYS